MWHCKTSSVRRNGTETDSDSFAYPQVPETLVYGAY